MNLTFICKACNKRKLTYNKHYLQYNVIDEEQLPRPQKMEICKSCFDTFENMRREYGDEQQSI